MAYFNSRYLKYETNAKSDNFLDYGEVVQVINDKLINLNMAGTGYILEAVGVYEDYIPKLGDWATVEWRNGQPIAKGGSGIATGLRNVNDNVKIISTGDVASGVIDSDHIRTDSIEARHISAYSIEAEHITANAIQANHISANTINAGHITANAITSEKIDAQSILSEHIQAGQINATHIATDSILAIHISANSITSDHISANSITTGHISANSITSELIESNAIVARHITSETINAGHITANAINSDHISSNSIQTRHIGADSITSAHISAGVILSNHISANQIKSSHIEANAIKATHISANQINASHISSNSIQSRHISANSINAGHISANSIESKHIKAGVITSEMISANSIISEHLQALIVDGYHIVSWAISGNHISAESIQTQHLSSNIIYAGHITADAIESRHIKSDTIEARHIKADSIQATHISANSVNAGHISANSIQTKHISANSVVSNHISANQINGNHISANTVETKHIKADSITSDLISANAVQAKHILANTIESSHIKAGQIQATHISANSINASHISANSIQTRHISANTIESEQIKANAINASHISANSVNAWHVSANSIRSIHIDANSIESRHISANTIESSHIKANQINTNHISANTIQSNHITANAIQTKHISSNTITGEMLKANIISGNHIVAESIDTEQLAVGNVRNGLLGQYYTFSGNSSNKFQNYKGSQIDANIDFSWSSTSGPSIIGEPTNYAVRWQGFVVAPETGNYTFHATADDAIRVVFNNAEIINQTSYVNNTEQNSATLQLVKGQWYSIIVEYFQGGGSASVKLRWTRPSMLKEVIPSKYFMQANTVIDGSTITTGSITATSIKAGTITADSGIIADLAIQTAHIGNGVITSAKIGNAEIKKANIADATIQNSHIIDATIEYAKINSVDASTITVGKLVGSQISGGTITGQHISGSSIQGQHISANSIESKHIKAGQITASELSAGSVTASKIEAGAITGDSIRAGSISAHHISTVGLDAQQITVYNSATGETLIGSGFLRVDGLDVGVVRSDNLLANGLFMTASSAFGLIRDNVEGETIAGIHSSGQGGHKIWKIDMTTGQRISEIDLGGKKPLDIAIHPSGNHAYVTFQGSDKVIQLDIVNDIAGETIPTPKGPSRIKWTGTQLDDHKHFFVLNTDPADMNIPDALTVIDSPPDSVGGDLYLHHNIVLGNNPVDFIIDSNKQAYITMGSQGDIVQLDMSGHDSSLWRIVGRIPVTAYGTDVYHGGLDGTFGLSEVTGGFSSAQYSTGQANSDGHSHNHGGYGVPEGDLKSYNVRGIAQSTDSNTLYVVDRDNGELVVVDKMGHAPYNSLTGATNFGTIDSGGHAGHNMSSMNMDMDMGDSDGSATSPSDLHHSGVSSGGGPGTYYVRYRIPVGDSPEFVELVNGTIVVTTQGSNELVMIREQDIIDEINADRDFYGNYLGGGFFEKWNPFQPMRKIGAFHVHSHHIGSRPTFMEKIGNRLFVSLSGQNQIAEFDMDTMTVVNRINTGANPRGFAITPDNKYMYVTNHGGTGELSFVYSQGPFIGDAFFGLEGGIVYQGAEYWTPDRSDWTYDESGNVKSYSTVEFRINEPFLNEGGYAKLTAYGKDYQYALIEQDIYNVTNYSNGSNTARYYEQRLIANSGNTTFYPAQEQWVQNPAPSNIKIVEITSGNRIEVIPPTSKYKIYYGESSRIEFSGGVVGANQWIEADYTSPYNQYFEPHNGSVLIAIENGSSSNFNTVFEIEEFVPKFVVFDNQQTEDFTPIEDGINQTYTGLEYSFSPGHSNAVGIPDSSITASGTITPNINPKTGARYPKNVIGWEWDYIDANGNPNQSPTNDSSRYVTVDGTGRKWLQIELDKTYMISHLDVFFDWASTWDLGDYYYTRKLFHHPTNHNLEDVNETTNKAYKTYLNVKVEVSEDGKTWKTHNEVSEFNSSWFGLHQLDGHNDWNGNTSGNRAKATKFIRVSADGWKVVHPQTGAIIATGNTLEIQTIRAYGDWVVEYGYKFPNNSEKAGQNVATNGKCFVTTDVPKAFVAFDVDIEFTSWWYMTYIVGPEFGEVAVEMPTAMGGSHVLQQDGMYINNIAHRHIMSFPPSKSIKADESTNTKAGKHRVVIRQSSGKVSFDRVRIEDFQFYRKNAVSIPSESTSTTFRRHKKVAEEAKWYVGKGKQSTEGAYDRPRTNPDSGLPDNSVPIKYRVRVMSELDADGTIEERGIAYITSAIFETGKQHTHWRPSASSDSYPASKIERWDGNQPHKTGIQTDHIAHGAIKGPKIMTGAIMDYHISNYARIGEHKLQLNHATHGHGRTVVHVGAGPMNTDVHEFISNKDTLDSIEGWSGLSGNYGISNTLARGDHKHNNASETNDGFITASDFTKLKGIQSGANNYSHPTTAGNKHVPSGGASGNFLKWSSNGTAVWSTPTWNDISGKPSTFTPSQHTHTVSQISDIGDNYYSKGEIDAIVHSTGDVSASGNNIFTKTNTFNNSGLAIKIQPSNQVPDATSLFSVNQVSGNPVFSVNYGKTVVIDGDLQVTGQTIQSGTQEIVGDYSIGGNMTVSGNSILGDSETDTTTVNGTLEVNGSIIQRGKLVEVMKFPIYGIAGDPEFQLENETSFQEIIGHLYTFNSGGNSALPPVPSGATRKYKLMIMYSTVGATSPATLRVVQNGTSTEITNVSLPTVNFSGVRGGTRTLLSNEFSTSFTGHTAFQAKCNQANTTLVVRYIELIAYDYYA